MNVYQFLDNADIRIEQFQTMLIDKLFNLINLILKYRNLKIAFLIMLGIIISLILAIVIIDERYFHKWKWRIKRWRKNG